MAAFVPHEPRRQRQGVALCLSGGGFRAALFHLGALRRLEELGVLTRLDAISSVSGGSIVAAHLAERLRACPAAGQRGADCRSRGAGPFRASCSRSMRSSLLLRRLLPT